MVAYSKVFKSLQIGRLSNEDCFQFISDIAGKLYLNTESVEDRETKLNDVDVLGIKPQYAALIEARDRMGIALEPIRKSPITKPLAGADFTRDDILQGIFGHVRNTARHHYDPVIRAMAVRLLVAVDHYAGMKADGYHKETGRVHNFMEEVNTNYSDVIVPLGLTGWLDALLAAHNAFKALAGDRQAEAAEKTELTVKDTRKEATKAVRDLFGFIEAKITVTGNRTPFEGFIRDANIVITEYANELAIHMGRLKAKKKGDANKEDGEESNEADETSKKDK
jgi:hypothetical protein